MFLVYRGAVFRAAPLLAGPSTRPGDEVVVDDRTEQVIRRALKWLAQQQQPSGSFSNSRYQVPLTAYSLMAFMSAGNLPNEGEHGKTAAKAVQFLLESVRPDGLIVSAAEGPASHGVMYGHGIATIALWEVYGQTQTR